jgi:hypothetical protein
MEGKYLHVEILHSKFFFPILPPPYGSITPSQYLCCFIGLILSIQEQYEMQPLLYLGVFLLPVELLKRCLMDMSNYLNTSSSDRVI